jgi:hypothetical protein
MSQLKVNALVSYSGNTVTLGTTGDTINVASGVTFNTASATVTLPSTINVTTVVLAAGAVGTPSLTTSGDTNTGIFFPAADTIAFTEGGAEAMRMDSSGKVLVGTTNDSVYNQNTVNGIVLQPGTSPAIQIANDPAGSTSNAILYLNMRNTPVNGAKYIRFFYNGASDIGNITLNGTTAVAYNTSSDYRLKENITAMLNAIARVKQLKPSTFNFKGEQNRIVDGFLAHEVQEFVPEAITGTKDEIDSKGNPIYQGIDQSKLVPLLTGALQEAIAKIESLEARLIALENN